LRRIELVETDKKDRPKQEVKIVKAVVFVNPIEEAEQLFEQELAEKRKAREERITAKKRGVKHENEDEDRIGWFSKPTPEQKPSAKKGGVGKYIGSESNTTLPQRQAHNDEIDANHAQSEDSQSILLKKKKKTPMKTEFKDFSGW